VKTKNVLIVEDDTQLQTVLTRLFEKQNYKVFVSVKLEESLDLIAKNQISLVLLDCLLPSMSGNEFGKRIRSDYSRQQLKIILMSGILTDKNFIKDSIAECDADGFLKKPFESKDLFAIVAQMDFKKNEIINPQPVTIEKPKEFAKETVKELTKDPFKETLKNTPREATGLTASKLPPPSANKNKALSSSTKLTQTQSQIQTQTEKNNSKTETSSKVNTEVSKVTSEPTGTTKKTEVLPPRKILYQFFSKKNITIREKIKVIEALDEIHGFDLPFLYSLLVETKTSGHLNIVNNRGNISGVSFSSGNIVSVDVTDRESFLGKLLIEGGYIHPDDLDNYVLNFAKKMGESLVQNNLLSPHAFEIVVAQQMNIRLSKTLIDSSCKLNFVPTEVDMNYPFLDSERFEYFLHDFIAGKLTKSWLKAHYTQWSDYSIEKGRLYSKDNLALTMPLIQKLDNFIEVVTSGAPLSQIQKTSGWTDEVLFKALHYLFCKGIIIFGKKQSDLLADRTMNLKMLNEQIQAKNPDQVFEIFANIIGINTSSLKQIESEALKFIGEDPKSSDLELQTSYEKVRDIILEAARLIKNSNNNSEVKKEAELQEVSNKIKLHQEFEKAKDFLQQSQYVKALNILMSIYKIDPTFNSIRLYIVWAKIGTLDSSPDKLPLIKEIDLDLAQVPLEQRYDAHYLYINALFLKNKGELFAAKKLLEKALLMDSSLLIIRRELSNIENRMKRSKNDGLSDDIKSAMSNLFKKK
jgi:DNA-binding response OmpR family regulator